MAKIYLFSKNFLPTTLNLAIRQTLTLPNIRIKDCNDLKETTKNICKRGSTVYHKSSIGWTLHTCACTAILLEIQYCIFYPQEFLNIAIIGRLFNKFLTQPYYTDGSE